MNVPRKLFALHSLDLWIYCREEGLSESMGTRQRKSKLPSSTWHTKATQIRHLRNFYRANNSMLLSGKPGSWWKRWRWRRERVAPTMEFFLCFSVLSRGSFFNCLLSLRVRFLLSGKTTPHMPFIVPCPVMPTWLLMEEGRGSFKGTLLTEGRKTLIVAHTAFFQWPQRDLLTEAIQLERRERGREREETTTREVLSPTGVTEDKEKAVLSWGQN